MAEKVLAIPLSILFFKSISNTFADNEKLSPIFYW